MTTFRILAAFGVLCAGAVAAMSFYVPDAHAQAACAPYKELQAALLKNSHEQPIGAGLAGEGKFAWTLFTSPNGESWTAVVVDTKGMACMVGAGKNWVDITPGKGEPT